MKKHSPICRHICIIPVAAVCIAVFGCAVMLLWNALLPRIMGLPRINFWEASGLLILARLLFGGLGGTGIHRGHKNLFREKWLAMSDEERKNFVMKHHGFHHHNGFSAEKDPRPDSASDDPDKG
jgi:hypothetical protein